MTQRFFPRWTMGVPALPAPPVLHSIRLGSACNLYEPPPTAALIGLWSEVHLLDVVEAPRLARTIRPNGYRVGRLYRAWPFVIGFGHTQVPEIGCELARGEWIRLDTGTRGRNLLELYAHLHGRSYLDAVTAIGMSAGIVAADGAVRPLQRLRHWLPELHPLDPDYPDFYVSLGYPPGSRMLSYRNESGHAVAQVIRIETWYAPSLDIYRSVWRHSLSAEMKWIETLPPRPLLFNEDQMFRRRGADIIFGEDEFVAHELGWRFPEPVLSAVSEGLEKLPCADLTGLRFRRVGVILRGQNIRHGRRIEAALRRAGVSELFFLATVPGTPRPFAELGAFAAAKGVEVLPVLEEHEPAPGEVVVWKAGEPMPGAAGERPSVIQPIVRAGDLIWIYGEPKSGKSWLAQALALLASTGAGRVGPWTAVQPAGVLLVDGEMHGIDLQCNIGMAMKGAEHLPPDSRATPFAVLCAKEQPEGIIGIADRVWQDRIETNLRGRTVLVLDNFQSLTDNGPGALKAIYPWLRRLTRAGIAVIIMDHTNRDGELQGSIMKQRIADLSIALTHANDEDRAAGIVTVDFPVARRLYGADAKPFCMERVFTADSFAFRALGLGSLSDPGLPPEEEARLCRMARVIIAREQGLTYDAIEEKYDIARSSAHLLARAALTLTGASKASFEKQCDHLRQEPSPQS